MESAAKNTPVEKVSYFKSFDGIRGTCCIMVLLVHYRFSGFNLPSSIVYIGLHCFFIMSAFLITKNLLRDKERSKNFWQCFKIFYIKRTARIFPVYFFYFVLTLVLFFLFKAAFHNTFYLDQELKHYWALLLTFTYNFKMVMVYNNNYEDYMKCLYYPHLWSLSLEEQFYIIIIFLAWVASKKILQILTVFFIVVIPIVRIAGYHWLITHTPDEHLRTLMLWQLPWYQFDAFFYGIALTVFDFKKSKIYLYLFTLSFLAIAGFGFYNSYASAKSDGVSIFVTLRDDKYFYRHYGYLFMDSLVNFFCVLWFLCVLYFPEQFKIFTNRLIVRVGELTYGLYIFQFLFLPIGLITAGLMHSKLHVPVILCDLTGVTIYLLLNFYFSLFIYMKLEIPIIKYKDVLLKKVYAAG
ncbi:MAG: acyltransferase [Bacteroidota bacterium]|nr:acyltransferase [Bacteroidota bacterium]